MINLNDYLNIVLLWQSARKIERNANENNLTPKLCTTLLEG